MKWLAVYRKECLDSARDRRSMLAAGLSMIAGPLVVALVLVGATRNQTTDGPLPLAIEGAERAPSLVAFLRANKVVVPSTLSPPPMRLIIDQNYGADFRAGRPARLTIEFDSAASQAASQAARLRSLVARFGSQVTVLRLIARGVDPAVATPLEVDTRDHAKLAPLAAAALGTIPIFLIAAAFAGSMNLAIDTTAGERERRSLEPLLLHPVSSWALASGKWLATFTAGAVSVVGMLVFLRLVFELPALQKLPVRVVLAWQQLGHLALLLVPLAALAAVAQLVLALIGKNFKEAQTYLSMLLLAPMVPGFLFAFGAAEPSPLLRALPLTGHHLLAKSILEGGALAPAVAVQLSLACAAGTLVLLGLLSWLLRRESVLRAG